MALKNTRVTNGVVRQNNPHANLPVHVHDLNIVSPQPSVSIGPSANGADERTPEAPKTSGYSNNAPMPDNHGARREGGLGEQGLGI